MMEIHRTAARRLLLVGIALVILNAFLVIAFYGPGANNSGPMFVPSPDAFPAILVPMVGFGGSLFGLWRTWRVWRGLR